MGRTWGKETFLRKCLKAGVSNSESYVENISAEDFQPSREPSSQWQLLCRGSRLLIFG